MKDLMQQPIYNFFISTIDEIKENLAKTMNLDAFMAISSLQQKIALSDYEPFAGYQALIEDLKIREQLQSLLEDIQHSRANDQPFMQKLNELKAFAHFLNFLDCSYESTELAKKHAKTMITNTTIQLGVVFKEIRSQSDCSDNTRMNIKEKEKEPLARPSEIELANYNNIITVYARYASFIGTEEEQITARAREFALLLFNDLKAIDESSDRMNSLKGNEDNLFYLGELEAVVTLSNAYKNEFQQQIEPSESNFSSPTRARTR